MKFPPNARRSKNLEDKRFTSEKEVNNEVARLIGELREIQNKEAKIKERK